MHLLPYKSFCEVQLEESEEDVVHRLGQPKRRSRNRYGELELEYEAMVVRLGEQGVVEITARPERVFLEGEEISRHVFASHLQAIDSGARSLHGFTVSVLYGVAIDEDSENDGWISVFTRGRWDSILHRKS